MIDDTEQIEYLGEIETEFENNLGWLSGAQMGSNREKNRGKKSRDTPQKLGWVDFF